MGIKGVLTSFLLKCCNLEGYDRNTIYNLLKSILCRVLFFGHGIAVIYLYVKDMNDTIYWLLLIPLIFLVIESFVTIVRKRGVEHKYFWSSGFLYITCIIQVIWLLQIDLYNQREYDGKQLRLKSNYTFRTSYQQENINAGIYSIAFDKSAHSVLKKVSELGLVLGIFIGRWLMPRGFLTKDQLSALLLTQVGNSADILELLKTIEETEIFHNKTVVFSIIAIFTLSMYQFALVTTATLKSSGSTETIVGRIGRERTRGGIELINDKAILKTYIDELRSRALSYKATSDERGKGKKITSIPLTPIRVPVNTNAIRQEQSKIKMRDIHGEVFQILVTLLMQDGPYLILRLILLSEFNIATEMHIFFICKNALVCILLVYRLLILSCSEEDEESTWHREDDEVKLHNVQLALEDQYTILAGGVAHISVL